MRRLIRILLNSLLSAGLALAAFHPALAQEGGEDAFIANLLPRLTPEVKIGQLFIVAFDGTDASEASTIADLIGNFHVGGVILSADHGNIVDDGDRTPTQVARLTASLQSLAARSSTPVQPGTQATPFIPLFVAMEQDGGGPAYSQITSGLTPQPSPMAIGATWNPDIAKEMGRIVGSELSAIGVNFLLGPALDVLAQPDPNGSDAGVRAFGGDPYWVGAMAGAFVRGLREGSGGRIAAALKHFPGEGGLRRGTDLIDESLDQIQRIDLAPYFALMAAASDQTRPLADAVLTSHARFRGFRSLRGNTDPISVDAAALNTLLQLPPITAWRDQGGLIVSGSLGDEPLRRFYDPTGATVPAEQIALDAFLAGNDVLILNNFSTTASPLDEAEMIRATVRAFLQRYREDLGFQARVESAVTRILRLKYRLYPGFQATEVSVVPDNVEAQMQQGTAVVATIAQAALTRVYPPAPQAEAAPLPTPAPDDSFLIFTDDRLESDCSRCPQRTTLFTTAISQTLTRVENVPPERIISLGFADLKAYLARAPAARDLSELFVQADWIILAQQDLRADVLQSDAAQLLLRNSAGLLANKRVALFAFGPPYEVSAPDLDAITAGYYALYSIEPPFVESAVRALFGQVQPTGTSPVSIQAVGYDIRAQLEPDPSQAIPLFVGEAAPGSGTPTPEPPSYRVGDDLRIRTGIILDRNGHPVPDGTPVRFTLVYRDAENKTVRPPEAMTVSGVAEVVVRIENNGRLEIRASSEPALNSIGLQLRIDERGETIVVTLALPPTPTHTLMPQPTPSVTPTATPTSTPIAWIDSVTGAEPRRANLIDFIVSLMGVTLVSAWGYRVESRRKMEGAIDHAVSLALWGSLCGLAAYTAYALGFPGSDAIRSAFGGWSALAVTLISAAVPWIIDRVRQRMNNG